MTIESFIRKQIAGARLIGMMYEQVCSKREMIERLGAINATLAGLAYQYPAEFRRATR